MSVDYSLHLRSVLENEVLSQEIQKLQRKTNSLNLACLEWLSLLEEHPLYQLHLNEQVPYHEARLSAGDKAKTATIRSSAHFYPLIVFGEWSLVQSEKGYYSFLARQCPPLEKIAESMNETLKHSKMECKHNHRFFFQKCNPELCYYCKEIKAQEKNNFPAQNWCVRNLKIYNGITLTNIPASSFQENLSGMTSFLGILHLKVKSRTVFGQTPPSYKIGGEISEAIVFQTSALDSEPVTYQPNLPSIDYSPLVEEEEK